MKAILFFCTLLAYPLLISPATFGQGRFAISATVSPIYRSLDGRSQIQNFGAEFSGRYSGFTTGLTVQYALHPNWSISSGLWYNQVKGDVNFQSFNGAAVSPAEPVRTETLRAVQVPLLLHYSPSVRRLSPYLSAGFLLTDNYRRTSVNNLTGREYVDKEWGARLHVLIGAGVQYRLSPKVSLIVQPTATYQLGRPDPSYTRFQDVQFGLQTQVKFTLP
ncbi:outer membrane beta-barrel protein [Spirosoma areae]